MRIFFFTILAGCMLAFLFPAQRAAAFEVGDTTPDWSMWDGWQEVNYGLYDYRGKIVLVNLFATW